MKIAELLPQCGNYRIFISLIFLVKSKLANLKTQMLPFQQIIRPF